MQHANQLQSAIGAALNAGKTKEEILNSVEAIIEQYNSTAFTKEDLEKRNYTYVSVHLTVNNKFTFEKFLVSSPYKSIAMELAKRYVQQKGWEVESIHLYPRNYIKEATKLFEENKFL